MFNRLPDRGQDTSRQIGDFQGVQAALGRAAGWDKTTARGDMSPNYGIAGVMSSEGMVSGSIQQEPPYDSVVAGQGYAIPRTEEFAWALSNPPMRAREGDMFN